MSDLEKKARIFSNTEGNQSSKLMREVEYDTGRYVGYLAGFKDCQKEYEEKLRWIPVEEKLPENGDEIELQNNEWINDFNPKGIRNGYYDKCKNPVFYSCFWNTDEECYDTSTQKPTHWRYFL